MICSCPFIHLANKHTSQSPSFQHCSLKSTVILSDFKKKYIYVLNKNGTFLTNKNLSGNIHQTKRKDCVLPRGNHDLKRRSSKKRKEKKVGTVVGPKQKLRLKRALLVRGRASCPSSPLDQGTRGEEEEGKRICRTSEELEVLKHLCVVIQEFS